MATTFIRVPQTGGAPEDYLVSGAADIDMLSCAAHFDGSSAGVDFLPAIQVLDEAGQVAATVVGSKVSAGGSADVTFAPFLESEAAATGGTGIEFDVANVGGYLDVTTNGVGVGSGYTQFVDESGGIFLLAKGSTPFMELSVDDPGELFLYANHVLCKTTDFDVRGESGGTLFEVTAGVTSAAEFDLTDTFTVGAGGDIFFEANPGNFIVRIHAGQKVEVRNRSGAPIFRVNEDGSLQGKTGQALTFNL